MKAEVAVLAAPRSISFIEEELPALGDGDILIKMESVGLCHSELAAYLGMGGTGTSPHGYRCAVDQNTYPAGLGHEAVATVLECGKAVRRFSPGDKIAGRMRGCLRTFAIIRNADIPVANAMLFKIPETNKDFRLCLSEPLECVVNIVKAAACQYGERIAVVGCGFMGLLSIAGLQKSGARQVTAVDIIDEKLRIARKYGATDAINSREEALEEAAYHLTGGHFYDAVIEITGSIKGLDTAMQLVKPAHRNALHTEPFQGNGRVLLPSVYNKEEVFPKQLGTNLMLKTPILHSVHPMYGLDPCANHVEGIDSFVDGRLPIDEMVTHTLPFRDVATGYEWLVKAPEGYIKGMVIFD